MSGARARRSIPRLGHIANDPDSTPYESQGTAIPRTRLRSDGRCRRPGPSACRRPGEGKGLTLLLIFPISKFRRSVIALYNRPATAHCSGETYHDPDRWIPAGRACGYRPHAPGAARKRLSEPRRRKTLTRGDRPSRMKRSTFAIRRSKRNVSLSSHIQTLYTDSSSARRLSSQVSQRCR